MKVLMKIFDKESKETSEPIDIMDLINGEWIEFEFTESETSLPYKDFKFFRDDYDVILEVEDEN